MNDRIVWFEFNDWISGDDFPDEELYLSWMRPERQKDHELYVPVFSDTKFLKENELVVVSTCIDMSHHYIIGAKESWINQHCPSLLGKYKKFVLGTSTQGEEEYISSNALLSFINLMYDDKTKGNIYYFNEETCEVNYEK